MPEETNPAPSPPAGKEAKQPKARKAPGKSRTKAAENKGREEAGETKSDPVTNAEDQGKPSESGKPQEGKRPNRRRRGKGKAQGNEEESPGEKGASPSGAPEKREPKETPAANAQRPPQQPRRKVDPDKLAKNAWKIYLAEVSEEGVALIGDNDARELARRCFRLAEIFLEEEDRRS